MSFVYSMVFILFYSCFGDKNRDLLPNKAPLNVTIFNTTEKNIFLTWNPIEPSSVRGTFRGYLVRIWNHRTSHVYAIPPDVTKAKIEFMPYSKNFITVSVRNNKFVGPPSEALRFDAPQAAPTFPYLFESHQLGKRGLLLQWNMPKHPNGLLIGYKIYWTEINSTYINEKSTQEKFIDDPHKFQTKLTNLKEGAKYRVGISALNCVGESIKNYLDIIIDYHKTQKPSIPDFKYRIDYEPLHIENECSRLKSNQNIYDDDFFLTNSNNAQFNKNLFGGAKNPPNEGQCFVTTRITWIPDIDDNPGDHFYVKYRIKGAPEYFQMAPEFDEDHIYIEYFDACANYELIVVSVDGTEETESDKIETPSFVFKENDESEMGFL